MRFDGSDYIHKIDSIRLSKQHIRIKTLMMDGVWRSLKEIEDGTNDPISSISAQLRHLRKPKFGSFVVEKRTKTDRSNGLFEYRVLPPNGEPQTKRGFMEQFIRENGLWDEFLVFKNK